MVLATTCLSLLYRRLLSHRHLRLVWTRSERLPHADQVESILDEVALDFQIEWAIEGQRRAEVDLKEPGSVREIQTTRFYEVNQQKFEFSLT